MNERLNSARIECLCGRWVMVVVDDRGPGRLFRWAQDDETLAETGAQPMKQGGFYACQCGRVYRALDNEPWIEESPLKEGLTYRVTISDAQTKLDEELVFIGVTQEGRAQFRGEDTNYIFAADHIRQLVPGQ